MKNNDKNNSDINLNKKDYIIDKIFLKKYRCIERIGKGAFGFIYKAEYNNKYYALKFEDNQNSNLLENEASLMIYLKGPNIPFITTYGISGGYNILVMQLLGKDLQEIFIEKGPFSIKTACILGYQMISILEHIHNKNVIHRDVKPENFLMGLEEKSNFLYLLDFGLAKTFNIESTKEEKVGERKLTGTPRYASVNTLRGIEQSQRDDLESVGYVLIYLLKGQLPWQGIKAKSKIQKIKNILVNKIETCSTDLCSDLPEEFEKYIDYCKDLEINEIPDYSMLKNLFLEILQKEKMEFDYIYDWCEGGNNNNNVKKNYSVKNKSNSLKNKKEYNSANKNINNLITEDRPIAPQKKDLDEILEENNAKENEKEENKEENEKTKEEVCCCFIY